MGLGNRFEPVINSGNFKCEFWGLFFLLFLNSQFTKSLFKSMLKKKKGQCVARNKPEVFFLFTFTKKGKAISFEVRRNVISLCRGESWFHRFCWQYSAWHSWDRSHSFSSLLKSYFLYVLTSPSRLLPLQHTRTHTRAIKIISNFVIYFITTCLRISVCYGRAVFAQKTYIFLISI